MNAAMPGQAAPWQVITDVMSELLRGGQTAGIRCRAALSVLERNGISFGVAEALCPEGCGCRLGTEDADARECGCYGPCTGEDDGSGPTGQLREFDYLEES